MKSSARVWFTAAAVYAACGILFGQLSANAPSHLAALVWRWAAWAVSAVTFGWQIVLERRRFGNSARGSALRAASASALGAFGLAAIATYHSFSIGRRPPPLLLASLALWPAIVFVPAFLVAWLVARLTSDT